MSKIIDAATLRQLVDRLIAEGKQVAGPRFIKHLNASRSKPQQQNGDNAELVQYASLTSGDQLILENYIHPANSIKEFFFPKHEKLYSYKFDGKRIELSPAELPAVEQIIIGARPCDAASVAILDHIFNWDFTDEFFNARRKLSTVIALACRNHDDHCFCNAIGSGPGDARGSDVLLLEIGDGTYEVRCLTEKGEKLFAGQTTDSDKQGTICKGPEPQFDLAAVGDFLAAGYEKPEWRTMALRCLGCGACAYTCPTCHCFDIVDEGNLKGGARVRNWDACQFAMFTMHASGHNPRANQAQRQRQRIFHKFQIYPDKFGEVLCTGCGNCTRNCPVAWGVLNVLKSIAAGQNSTKSPEAAS